MEEIGDEDYWEGLLRSDEEEESDESEQDTEHRESIVEVIKVETVEVSKEHNPCSSTRSFYKCRCSKEVLLDERQFTKHLMEGECEEHREYNSHFLKEGRLIKNKKIDEKILKRLYFLQNKIQKQLFICNCG